MPRHVAYEVCPALECPQAEPYGVIPQQVQSNAGALLQQVQPALMAPKMRPSVLHHQLGQDTGLNMPPPFLAQPTLAPPTMDAPAYTDPAEFDMPAPILDAAVPLAHPHLPLEPPIPNTEAIPADSLGALENSIFIAEAGPANFPGSLADPILVELDASSASSQGSLAPSMLFVEADPVGDQVSLANSSPDTVAPETPDEAANPIGPLDQPGGPLPVDYFAFNPGGDDLPSKALLGHDGNNGYFADAWLALFNE